ncbi:hypothetical protein GcC1_093012 [Golovinomyces cichoracearum]|uniref:C3H1-type domain-containing protein n=1 Tax=Golovinomyces cichoracearum TaxID=62708 RepID=A0A420IDL2_9PEZI|nr:hypothetical protein GcC1_093012 [Golovinomyces cichoracearum]
MSLSPLMLTILEQAKEPLLCLNGAGYFTEDEWFQLDLIMNKKYLWTKGPKKDPQPVKSTTCSAKVNTHINRDDSTAPVSPAGIDKMSSSPEEKSTCTSIEPLSDDLETQTISTEATWELSPAMNSPVPAKNNNNNNNNKNHPGPNKNSVAKGLIPRYNYPKIEDSSSLDAYFMGRPTRETYSDPPPEPNQPNGLHSYGKSNPSSASIRYKNVSSWASEVYNSPLQKIDPRPDLLAPGLSSERHEKPTRASNINPKENLLPNKVADVNAFETSNAEEWDEVPVWQNKAQDEKNTSILTSDKIDNIVNTASLEQSSNMKDTTSTTSHPSCHENYNNQRSSAGTRTARRREIKRPEDSRDESCTPPTPKTKTCWFWAEAPGGCRYRPEECLNLHVHPLTENVPSYPFKDGKPTWGRLADAVPQEVPLSKRPRSCWFWATRGYCEKGDSCDYVHGWVIGGVASRPRNLDYKFKPIGKEKSVYNEKVYEDDIAMPFPTESMPKVSITDNYDRNSDKAAEIEPNPSLRRIFTPDPTELVNA